MSFSGTLSYSPPQEKRQGLSLSEALYEFGFEPGRTENYDWMAAYPDAIPLLEAIRTNLDPSSVLSASEAERLKSLALSHENVSSSDIIDTAQPLINVPFQMDVGSTREALLSSARNRVELLKVQREVLRDTLRREREDSLSSKPVLANKVEQKTIQAKTSKLLSTIEVLKQCVRRGPEILRSDSEIIRFCDTEAKHCETIASVITQGFRDDLRATSNHQAAMTSRTRQAISAYAKLKRLQSIYQALVLRDAAIIASLGTNDGRYLEMTASSMVSLIKETRSNAAKSIQLKANQVSEEAQDSLQNAVSLFYLSERASQQDTYIDAIRQCISLYLEQRLRIHCLQTVANSVTAQRSRTLDLLKAITPDLSSVMIDGDDIPSNVDTSKEMEEGTESATLSRNKEAKENCHICKNGKFSHSLKELENKVFLSHVDSSAAQISSITRNTGESSSWLRLSSNPKSDALIKELEDELGKNTMVLEALLQKKGAIVDKALSSNQSQSPSHSWISRINSTHSPKLSSYSSSSSR